MAAHRAQFQWGPEHVRQWLATADRILQGPVTRPHIVRPVPHGDLVARFALPLELCKPTNQTRRGLDWQFAKTRLQIRSLFQMQEFMNRKRLRSPAPLGGRPQILCCRFSPSEPDAFADWAKSAVDCLGVDSTRRNPKTGAVVHVTRMNYIVDDAPAHVDLRQWAEKCKRDESCVTIEVWTGAACQ